MCRFTSVPLLSLSPPAGLSHRYGCYGERHGGNHDELRLQGPELRDRPDYWSPEFFVCLLCFFFLLHAELCWSFRPLWVKSAVKSVKNESINIEFFWMSSGETLNNKNVSILRDALQMVPTNRPDACFWLLLCWCRKNCSASQAKFIRLRSDFTAFLLTTSA